MSGCWLDFNNGADGVGRRNLAIDPEATTEQILIVHHFLLFGWVMVKAFTYPEKSLGPAKIPIITTDPLETTCEACMSFTDQRREGDPLIR